MALLAPSDAVLLLPRVPDTAELGVEGPAWSAALRRWKIDQVASGGSLGVVHARDARPGPTTLAVCGRLRASRRRRLVDAGYDVASYAVTDDRDGAIVVRPATGWRATFHVADREDAAPAALAASGHDRLERATFAVDQRRRVPMASGGAVVKVERERVTVARGDDEQAVLVALHERGVGELVPRPLGAGVAGGIGWSAESFVSGRPLHELRDLAVYDRIGRWLLDLAVATRADRTAPPIEADVLPLRGDAHALLERLPMLGLVPAVLVHGDLATGVNVLVDGQEPRIIDWETARWSGLPLADLVPLMCLGSARAAGCRTVEEEAQHVLDLCGGRADRSGWLFEHVGRHLDALGVSTARAGVLAAIAWGALASMRIVYRELVPAAPDWRTAADLVVAAWHDDPALGDRWSALAEHLARR